MFRKLLTIAAVGCSLIWAQQGNVIYPIAQQNMDAYQRDQWNKGSGTRTDLAPKLEKEPTPNADCPMTPEELQSVGRAWDLQNSRASILTVVANAAALKTATESWHQRCDGSDSSSTDTRSSIGLPEGER
jgi:hypothetical protein